MFEQTLFLGIQTDTTWEKATARSNPHLLNLFTSGDDYLSKISFKKERYLGKPVPPYPTLSQLESLESHLLSLLRKIAPDYPFSKNPPILLTLHDIPGNRG